MKRKSLIKSIRKPMPPSKQVFKDKKAAVKRDKTGRKQKYKEQSNG